MKIRFWLLALFVMVSACSRSLQAPALHDFGSSNAGAAGSAEATVDVVAPKWLSDKRIRYRLLYNQPTRVRFYNLDQWIASPPELLKQHLISAISNRDYTVTVYLQDFEQQFIGSGNARVILRFYAEVKPIGGEERSEQRSFSLQSGPVSADAQGAVIGFAELARAGAKQIDAWLKENNVKTDSTK